MANEKRLIDANALLELVQFRLPIDNQNAEVIAGCVNITRRLIENAPTVDAVEVVRCKDCIYWEKATANKKGFLICPASGMEIMAHDFCSYGERRDNERKAD